MSRTDVFDLGALRLVPGEGRRLDLEVPLAPLTFSGEQYEAVPSLVPVRLDLSRMTGGGYSLRLRFAAALHGPCMRCLRDAEPTTEVDAREIDQPGHTPPKAVGPGGDELTSPYVTGEELDLGAWARDAFALALPAQVVCREDCRGLCPICGEDLNEAGPGHRHASAPDPRWAKLRELNLE
jgi:Predicted metal-binding, possibly nucleic acid-binding protein